MSGYERHGPRGPLGGAAPGGFALLRAEAHQGLLARGPQAPTEHQQAVDASARDRHPYGPGRTAVQRRGRGPGRVRLEPGAAQRDVPAAANSGRPRHDIIGLGAILSAGRL